MQSNTEPMYLPGGSHTTGTMEGEDVEMTIWVLCARNLPNTAWFGAVNPYVVLSGHTVIDRSHTSEGSGPNWGTGHFFTIRDQTTAAVTLEVFHEGGGLRGVMCGGGDDLLASLRVEWPHCRGVFRSFEEWHYAERCPPLEKKNPDGSAAVRRPQGKQAGGGMRTLIKRKNLGPIASTAGYDAEDFYDSDIDEDWDDTEQEAQDKKAWPKLLLRVEMTPQNGCSRYDPPPPPRRPQLIGRFAPSPSLPPLAPEEQKIVDQELHAAASKGDLDGIEGALRRGANLEHRDSFGRSSLDAASMNGKARVVELLLDLGCDPNAVPEEREGAGKGDNLFWPTAEKIRTPLMHAACGGSDTPIHDNILLLFQFGARLNTQVSGAGSTALHLAVEQNNHRAVRALRRCGARYDIRDGKGRLPRDIEHVQKNVLREIGGA